MKFSDLTSLLVRQNIPFALLGSVETGRALVIEEGARVLALAAPGSEENLFWNHAEIGNCRDRAQLVNIGIGGAGGLRLWQAPEGDYMWKGMADTAGFSNYEVQTGTDPGHYTITQTSTQRAVVQGCASLKVHRTGEAVSFQARRIVELFPLPERYKALGVNGLTLRLQQTLRLTDGAEDSRLDLWNLVQLPVPCKIGAFVNSQAEPQIYFNPQSATGFGVEEGRFSWQTDGEPMCKIGLSSKAVTRGMFAMVERGDVTGVYLWNIHVAQGDCYVDAAPGHSSNDQAVQFWDGGGFCEIEYHSPGVSLASPEVFDASELIYLEVPRAEKARCFKELGLS